MAKMIKHKDSYFKNSVYQDMLKKITKVETCTEVTSKVQLTNQHGQVIEVKVLSPITDVVQNIESEEYSGEISEFLFSYYIGEV
jgi:phage-related protein